MPASVGRPHPTPARAAPSSEPAADAAPVPATTAAPAPAIPEEPAAPEPVAPYVEAAETRKKVPVWIVPVLIFLPFWAIFYVGYLENPPAAPEGLAYEGAEIYSGQCAGCHGGGGGGGSGRQLNGGEVLLTFPSLASGASYDGLAGHLHWVANGTAGSQAEGLLVYGDPDRPGGAHAPGSYGQMADSATSRPSSWWRSSTTSATRSAPTRSRPRATSGSSTCSTSSTT